jgi:hypothetical protein
MLTKFNLQTMTKEDHEYVYNILNCSGNFSIDIDNLVVTICSWDESGHNGDVYNERDVQITLPNWLNVVLNKTNAKHVSKEIAKINSSMKNTFDALIALNNLLENK